MKEFVAAQSMKMCVMVSKLLLHNERFGLSFSILILNRIFLGFNIWTYNTLSPEFLVGEKISRNNFGTTNNFSQRFLEHLVGYSFSHKFLTFIRFLAC